MIEAGRFSVIGRGVGVGGITGKPIETRMSVSVPIVPPSESLDLHTVTQLPAPSVVICGLESDPESVAALVLSTSGVIQLAPLFVESEAKISKSVPIVPFDVLSEFHIATQLPMPSVVIVTPKLNPRPEAVLGVSEIGVVHVAPLFVERETRVSISVWLETTFCHITTQLPVASVVISGDESDLESALALVLSAIGEDHVIPLFVERETRISNSPPIVPPSESPESHTVTQFPKPSVVICGRLSRPELVELLSVAGEVHVAPLFVERETRMSASFKFTSREEDHTATQLPAPSVVIAGTASLLKFPTVLSVAGAVHVAPLFVEHETRTSTLLPRLVSQADHTATQLPWPSVATCGQNSSFESVAALELSAAGADQVAPLLVECAIRMSSSVPIVPPSESAEPHTATQLPTPSVVTCGELSVPESVAALVFSAIGCA